MTGQQAEKMNPKFDIPIQKLEDFIGVNLNGDYCGYERVVSPKDLQRVTGISFLKRKTFEALLKKVPIKGNNIYPYENARIEIFSREPQGMDTGQIFVLETKIIDLMKNLEKRIFERFFAPGLSRMPPVQIYGLDYQNRKAMAFYIPPIIEIHNDCAVLLDGSHRCFICNSAGASQNAIHISNVKIPLPFDPISYRQIKLVKEKPPVSERYRNLRKQYFRDLSAVGIDG